MSGTADAAAMAGGGGELEFLIFNLNAFADRIGLKPLAKAMDWSECFFFRDKTPNSQNPVLNTGATSWHILAGKVVNAAVV